MVYVAVRFYLHGRECRMWSENGAKDEGSCERMEPIAARRPNDGTLRHEDN
eukprot:CAMPEP_0117689822 /NCGR_PEP_ID=MMETSP0804-20121206/24758_1 /TAXON_ID=1074897 /ORGANISM="Tetraselmis astigmatica, Strain CCMP880" /LENGTH=50 /DNA_ID=CAMNT_0005502747 /DNA_START=11 /DNA_END=160 /DNA_ORIENTATION=+